MLPGLGVKRAKGQRPSFLDGDKERGMSVASIFLSVKRFLTVVASIFLSVKRFLTVVASIFLSVKRCLTVKRERHEL